MNFHIGGLLRAIIKMSRIDANGVIKHINEVWKGSMFMQMELNHLFDV